MTIPHNTATAILTIDGMAICCFNTSTHVWDLAFLHKDDPDANPACNHVLTLNVPEESQIHLPHGTNNIFFEVVNPAPVDYAGTYPRGFFDKGPINDRTSAPTNADALENFRWVLDLEDSTDVPNIVGLKKPSVRPTRAFIHNAVFYTSAIASRDLYRVVDGVDPNGLSTGQLGQALLGKTNDRIGADIFCAQGGYVVIKADGIELGRLPHRPGNPWQIELTNLCRRDRSGRRFDKGDFHLFYDALNFTGPKLAIWGEPVEADALLGISADIVSGRADCDTTRTGTSTNLNVLFS
jgi:hypothetical protein